MGTLFPGDDEYPNHQPVPWFQHVRGVVAFWVTAAFFALWDLRPGSGAKPDPPAREFVPLPPRQPEPGFGSSSVSLDWLGNSTDAAAVAIRGAYARRTAQTHAAIAAAGSSTNAALLYSST